MRIEVCLVSPDKQLREFFTEVAGQGLIHSLPTGKLPPASFYIYDFQPAAGLPKHLPPFAKCLFLIDPKDFPVFSQQVKDAPVCILLKPVSETALRDFFDKRIINCETTAGASDTHSFRSERDHLLQHLLEANQKLQEYEQERTNFLARALHDLRAPLTALQGFCGLLLDSVAGPLNSRQREMLQRMHNSSRRLARLGSDILELSVYGHLQRSARLEPGDFEDCLAQALHEVSAAVQEKHLQIVTQIDPPPKAFFFEPQQIEQLLINLIENACRFTPRSGRIHIRGYGMHWDSMRPARLDSPKPVNAYRVDIKDPGPGIDPSLLETIFAHYTSFGGPKDRSGGGLGLAICKRVVSAHGGRIWASSSKHGATFSFVLPLEPKVYRLRPLGAYDTPYRAARSL